MWGWGDEGSLFSGVMPHQGAAEQTAWWGMFQAGCSENLRLEREREREREKEREREIQRERDAIK